MMNSKRIYSSSDSSKSCSSASVGIIRIRGGGGSGGSGGSGSPPSHADLFRRAECSALRDAGVPSTGTGGVIVLQQNNLNNGAGLSGFLKGKELSFGGGGGGGGGEILLHDMEKTGCSAQEGQRDRGSIIGVLKRASPTHCLTTNGVLPPDGLSNNNSSSNNSMHLDIRNPGKRVELLTNGFHHHHQVAPPGRSSNGAIVTPAVLPEERQQQQSHPSCHSIPVPRHRKPSGHADKEVMAATVLTSLSTSPLVLHPASTTPTVPEPASRGWKEALSASYSSSTSGNWSWDASDQSVPSTPSPPLTNDAAKGFLLSSHGDDVSEDATDGTHFLFEDPIPRKRKNSMKVMFKCLWKNCEKVLSTSSGIQRHVRTVHLGRNSDSDYSDGEEDFYYSEIEVNVDSLTEGLSSLTPTSPTTAGPPPFFPSPSVVLCGAAHVPRSEHISVVSGHQPPPPQQQPLPAPPQPLEHHPAPTLLSQSAPSTFCHIRTDHAYQATAPVSIPVAAGLAGPGCAAGWNSGTTGSVNGTGSLSVSWQASPPVIFKGLPPGPVQAHVRTVSIGEKRQPVSNTHAAATKNHALINPAPKPAPGTRKPRGEAKKCRKVYGMEKRDMWCTACRWKKACQRFTD